jgi:hypothetical protein
VFEIRGPRAGCDRNANEKRPEAHRPGTAPAVRIDPGLPPHDPDKPAAVVVLGEEGTNVADALPPVTGTSRAIGTALGKAEAAFVTGAELVVHGGGLAGSHTFDTPGATHIRIASR